MPKANQSRHQGCRIKGIYLQATGGAGAGKIVIRPERACVYGGAVYSVADCTVEPGPDGRFEVVLPPSKHAGLYKVFMGDARFQLNVPEADEAEFGAIAGVI